MTQRPSHSPGGWSRRWRAEAGQVSRWRAPALLALAVTTVAPVLAAASASAAPRGFGGAALPPGDLLISGSVYTGSAGLSPPG